ncbi:MAG: hypothetical protein ACE5NG_16340 [bacterium]
MTNLVKVVNNSRFLIPALGWGQELSFVHLESGESSPSCRLAGLLRSRGGAFGDLC